MKLRLDDVRTLRFPYAPSYYRAHIKWTWCVRACLQHFGLAPSSEILESRCLSSQSVMNMLLRAALYTNFCFCLLYA